MSIMKAKLTKEEKRNLLIAENEKLKTDVKEQKKLARQLLKLGIL